jgi:hypothetical protein
LRGSVVLLRSAHLSHKLSRDFLSGKELIGPFLVTVYYRFTFVWTSIVWQREPDMVDPLLLFLIGAMEAGLVLSVRSPVAFLAFACIPQHRAPSVQPSGDFLKRHGAKPAGGRTGISLICGARLSFTLLLPFFLALAIVWGLTKAKPVSWPLFIPSPFMVADVAYWGRHNRRFVQRTHGALQAAGAPEPDNQKGPKTSPAAGAR